VRHGIAEDAAAEPARLDGAEDGPVEEAARRRGLAPPVDRDQRGDHARRAPAQGVDVELAR
jgi:hypothetical protein